MVLSLPLQLAFLASTFKFFYKTRADFRRSSENDVNRRLKILMKLAYDLQIEVFFLSSSSLVILEETKNFFFLVFELSTKT